jgi:hypothetical protein
VKKGRGRMGNKKPNRKKGKKAISKGQPFPIGTGD